MKKFYLLTVFGILCPVLFCLLEPIILYTSGWSSFPETNSMQPIVHHQDATSKEADRLLRKIFSNLNTPALSVAIGKNNTVVWSNAIGYEDIENNIKAGLQTKFRIGSTSKAVTSIGLGILIQNKELGLASKVKEYVPYASQTTSQITIKQLASHTSGIRNYGLCFCFPLWEYFNNDEYTTIQESVAVFNNDDLLFLPGTDFSYSTYNYTLLSAVIEGASKMSFPDFMKTSVFKPLKLETIDFENESISPNNLSKFYSVESGQYKEVYTVNNSNKWAGGGMVSSPTDLVVLGNSFLNNSLLTKKITTSLTTPVKLVTGEMNEQYYALGWRNTYTTSIFKNKRKIQILHHAGVANGATSVFILFPEYNVTVSLLVNSNPEVSDLFEYSYELAKLFMI